jgi:predicted DNA-binding antitoxin AbrB/MazE fold protein
MDISTTTIDAVYSGGVLRPLGEVKLEENEHVRLTISPAPKPLPPEVAEWLARTAAHRQAMLEDGYCHDTTELIAEMRRRDS